MFNSQSRIMATIEKFVFNCGNLGLIIDGYEFGMNKTFKNSKLGRCIEKKRKSRCKTDPDEVMVLDGTFEHDHAEPDKRGAERQKIRQACKRKPKVRETELMHVMLYHTCISCWLTEEASY